MPDLNESPLDAIQNSIDKLLKLVDWLVDRLMFGKLSTILIVIAVLIISLNENSEHLIGIQLIPAIYNYYFYLVIAIVFILALIIAIFEKRLTAIKDNAQLKSGAIIYASISGYSVLNIDEQSSAVGDLDRVAKELFSIDGQQYPSNESFYYWYKLDGADLYFFIEDHHTKYFNKVTMYAFLSSLVLLHRLSKINYKLKVGITIHSGNDMKFIRNGQLCDLQGKSLYTTKQLMGLTDSNHFFLSSEAFLSLKETLFNNELKGTCKKLLRDSIINNDVIFQQLKPDLPLFADDDLFELQEWSLLNRTQNECILHNFHTSPNFMIGNPKRPPDFIPIERRDTLHTVNDPIQIFIKNLIEADDVCIVGLTHENLANFLRTALIERNGIFWKKIQIIFPNENSLNETKEKERDIKERRSKWIDGKREILTFLGAQGEQCLEQWSCLEYSGNLSFWGNRLISDTTEKIRIAPLMQGADLSKIPYMTFFKQMDVYNILSDAFDVIIAGSKSLVEWDLFGTYTDNKFIYQGIAYSSQLANLTGYCKPVVLIMLYTQVLGSKMAVLQKRTIFNATDSYGTFSNISGRLCINDIAEADKMAEFYNSIKALNSSILEPQKVIIALATQYFAQITGYNRNTEVLPEVWEQAAQRELNEELGLPLENSDRLHFQRNFESTGEHHLYFSIYSLEIKIEEYASIKNHRPHASLETFDLSRLNQYWTENKFNRLLQRQFENVFLPIFHDLNIK